MVDLEKIRQTAERVAASHQMDLVDLEYAGSGKQPVLRVFIEKNARERTRLAEEKLRARKTEQTGEAEALDQLAWITHEDCEIFSRDFGTVIEVDDAVPDRQYVLEVSSPGLDRRLHDIEEYQRFRGSLIKIETLDPVVGNRHWLGRLTEVRGDRVLIDPSPDKKKRKSRGKRQAVADSGREHTALEIALTNISKANLVPEF